MKKTKQNKEKENMRGKWNIRIFNCLRVFLFFYSFLAFPIISKPLHFLFLFSNPNTLFKKPNFYDEN
jgi:hypothetical protein